MCAKSLHFLGSAQDLTLLTINLDTTKWLFRCNLPDDSIQLMNIVLRCKPLGLMQQVFNTLFSGLPGCTVRLPTQSPKSGEMVPAAPGTSEVRCSGMTIEFAPVQMLPATAYYLLNFRVLMSIFPPVRDRREMADATIVEDLMQIQCAGMCPITQRCLDSMLKGMQLRGLPLHRIGNGIRVNPAAGEIATVGLPLVIQ